MDNSKVNIYLGSSSIRTCLGNKAETLMAMRNGESGLVYSDVYSMPIGITNIKESLKYTRFESLLMEQLLNIYTWIFS